MKKKKAVKSKDHGPRCLCCSAESPGDTLWALILVILLWAQRGGLSTEDSTRIYDDLSTALSSLDGAPCDCGSENCRGTMDIHDVSCTVFGQVEKLAARNKKLRAGRGAGKTGKP